VNTSSFISSIGTAASSVINSLGASGVFGTTSQQALLNTQLESSLLARGYSPLSTTTSGTMILLLGAAIVVVLLVVKK